MGHSPWGHKESDTTKRLNTAQQETSGGRGLKGVRGGGGGRGVKEREEQRKMFGSLPFPAAWAVMLVQASLGSRKPGPLIQSEFLSLEDF